MRLVYAATRQPVKVGDDVSLGGLPLVVKHFRPPSHASSSGKVTVAGPDEVNGREYYVRVIGAVWIEREDQPDAATSLGAHK